MVDRKTGTGKSASINSATPAKPRKVPKPQRHHEILALQVAGLTQNEIAAKLGVSRATITDDLKELRESRDGVHARLNELQSEIAKLMPLKERAMKYAELAKDADSSSVELAALMRIDDLEGIVTEKERIRAKQVDPGRAAPMFVLPQGCNVAVTFNQVQAQPAQPNHDTTIRDISPADITTSPDDTD